MLHKLGIIQWTEISRSRSLADVEINAILCTSHPLSAGGVELSLDSDFQKLGGGVLEKGKSTRKRGLGRFADLRGDLTPMHTKNTLVYTRKPASNPKDTRKYASNPKDRKHSTS